MNSGMCERDSTSTSMACLCSSLQGGWPAGLALGTAVDTYPDVRTPCPEVKVLPPHAFLILGYIINKHSWIHVILNLRIKHNSGLYCSFPLGREISAVLSITQKGIV